MKTIMTATFAALFMSAGFVFATTNDIAALLQKGLFEEEANHNLEAAMRDYQAAVDGFDKDRQLAATAVFRLGECLRKQGRTNEAWVQYGRVLREFPDQTNLTGLSREYLAGQPISSHAVSLEQSGTFLTTNRFPAAGGTTSTTSAEDEEVRKITEMIRNSPDLINAPGSGGLRLTPLQYAVSQGYIGVAELALANGADIKDFGQYNRTLLGMAADNGNKAMIELLLAKGADVNAPDKESAALTPLHHAVTAGFKTVVEVLIARGADVNAGNKGGYTPLHFAASHGYSAVADLLLAHGARVNAPGEDGRTPLFSAVMNKQPEMVQVLLSNKAEVNLADSSGQTPLFMAKEDEQIKIARLLVAAKADVNHRDKGGQTPLHFAVLNNQPELVKLLLSNKADVNATTDIGITPLLFAVAKTDYNSFGQRQTVAGPGGYPALGSAATNLVKILLDNGADPQARIKEGGGSWGPIIPGIPSLGLAIQFKEADMMEMLLASHADPNVRYMTYQYSGTPLLWCLRLNFRLAPPLERELAKELKLLLDHGADPDLTDQDGWTPLSMAVSYGELGLVEQLLAHHADPNKPDNHGLPPLGVLAAFSDANPVPGQMDPVVMSEIKAALIKAGANEDFQRQGRIFIAQTGTGSLGKVVFHKGTNSVNHYTLLESLAEACDPNGRSPVEFPDFAHVVINRLKPGGGKEEIPVNLEEILTNGDYSKDMVLEWGDVVQIPQLDHLLNESQGPLGRASVVALTKSLQREVQIIVKGQTNKLLLLPFIGRGLVRQPYRGPSPLPLPPGSSSTTGTADAATEWTPHTSPGEKVLSTFSLDEVVHEANVLLLSSDLSRVKVTRHGAAMVFDLEAPAARPGGGGGGAFGSPVSILNGRMPGGFSTLNEDTHAFWLRDGDIIEIPERDPKAPQIK